MRKGLRLRILNFKKTIRYIENYDFLHFGTETCENLVFFYKKFLKDLFAFNKELIISFPPISENVFNYSKELFLNLKKISSKRRLIFSLNDFGMIQFVRENFPSSEIFIGRHLSKAFFSLAKKKLTINSLSSIKFLKKHYNVSKYEISSFYDIPITNLHIIYEKNLNISFFIHYPYVLLSTARNCVIGFNDLPPQTTSKGVICKRECLKGGYKVNICDIGQGLYLFENSLYKKIKTDNIIMSKLSKSLSIEGVIIDPF